MGVKRPMRQPDGSPSRDHFVNYGKSPISLLCK
jgi:hypothetical protein